MANERQNILELARKDGLAVPSAGLSVPDGYFDSFADKMAAMPVSYTHLRAHET